MTEFTQPVAVAKPVPQKRALIRYLALQPYGGTLLTPAAAFWIFAVRAAIALMASAEGLSWAYAAFYLSSAQRWLVATLVFGFIFVLIVIIDASLMTLDRWARRFDHRITSERAKASGIHSVIELASIGTRVSLVAASMYITAPFLAQLMFKGDIDQALANERTSIRAEQKQRLLAPLTQRSADLTGLIDAARVRLDKEVAGVGPSGRYGEGVAARQVRRTLESLEKERVSLGQRFAETGASFDALTDEQASQLHGFKLPVDTFQERGRILQTIATENYRLTERAVQAFLGFLFFGLLLLKLFEPRSVSVYFSERLQALHEQYRRGAFDGWLAAEERAWAGGGMAPLRFEDWCLNIYPVLRAGDVTRTASGFYIDRANELDDLRRRIRADEEPLVQEQAAVERQSTEAQGRSVDLGRRLDDLQNSLRQQTEHRARLDKGVQQARSAGGLATALGAIDALEEQERLLRQQVLALQEERHGFDATVSQAQTRLAEIRAERETLSKARMAAESEIATTRRSHMAAIGQIVAARSSASVDAASSVKDDIGSNQRVM
jgi:hypothetical protein